ncbi:MAG TPA: hypothetical protein DCM31_07715 [Deferribacteraceae bacterium]|nr:hypothetical protein [Deferribacteraceae bacterium]
MKINIKRLLLGFGLLIIGIVSFCALFDIIPVYTLMEANEFGLSERMHAYTTDKTPAAVWGLLGTISGIYCILTAFTKRSKS